MTDPAKQLQACLVGGAVRDQLLGLEVKDRDWVVVGASVEQMGSLGFRPVGSDFPVFLHPHNNEEYALARTERKIAKGYHGFEFHSSPDVTLEQDLLRRDLTINAMAIDAKGNLVDPFNGQQDIENRIIRHVSDAFREDPVRILRVAKFMARFQHLGFTVAPETLALMRTMVEAGEVDALVAERVWQELQSSLRELNPEQFVETLRSCNALSIILPEVDVLFGVPQVKQYHPEIDTGIHTLMVMQEARKITTDSMVIFAAMTHDLGKALTPEEELPSHRRHEHTGLVPLAELCQRLRVPKEFRWFAEKVCEYHLHCHKMKELKPQTVLGLLENLDSFRKPEMVEKFVQCCLADRRGRTGLEHSSDEQGNLLRRYHKVALDVDSAKIASEVKGLIQPEKNIGEEIKLAIRQQRIAQIKKLKLQIC